MRKPNDSADTIVRSNPPRFRRLVTYWFARLPGRSRFRQPMACPRCNTDVMVYPLYPRLRVCEVCGYYLPTPTQERIKCLVDPRSFCPFLGTIRADFAFASPHHGLRETVIIGTVPSNKASTKLWRNA
jgi:ribosomal protein S27E